MSIRINTQAVEDTAHDISKLNTQINSEYSEVERIMKNLEAGWIGTAADCAQGKLKRIKREYFELRFCVVERIPNFLKKKIGISYEAVESNVKTAADAFK